MASVCFLISTKGRVKKYMKYIIVEDDEQTIRRVKNIIKEIIFKYDIDYKIEVFNKYSEKLKSEILDNSKIKVYILSIDLKNNISGIDIAEFIRKEDWTSYILFLTKHGDMFELAHRKVYNIFEFIEKYQRMEQRLKKDITKIIQHQFDNNTFLFSYHGITYNLLYSSISIIKRSTKLRKLVIHTIGEDYICNMTLNNIIKKLDQRFIQVSKSTIINSDFLTEKCINKGYAIVNNTRVKISKKYDINKYIA